MPPTTRFFGTIFSVQMVMAWAHIVTILSATHASDHKNAKHIERILAGHAKISSVRENSTVWVREVFSSSRKTRQNHLKIWCMGDNFKVHEIKEIENFIDSDVADARIMSDASLIRVVTDQYEFSLQKRPHIVNGVPQLGPLKMATNSIGQNGLTHWRERMLLMLSQRAWVATTIGMWDSRSFFLTPEVEPLSGFNKTLLFEMGPITFRELPSGILRMEYSFNAERIDSRGVKTTVNDTDCWAEFDPKKYYRVVTAGGTSHMQEYPVNKAAQSRWGRLSSRYEYDETFGRGVIPRRVFNKVWINGLSRDDIKDESSHSFFTEEYLIDKVEFGTVTPADFRGEPYGVPASLIEQDPLPPPAAWWWPWLCGLLGVNALPGLVWWGKRQWGVQA